MPTGSPIRIHGHVGDPTNICACVLLKDTPWTSFRWGFGGSGPPLGRWLPYSNPMPRRPL